MSLTVTHQPNVSASQSTFLVLVFPLHAKYLEVEIATRFTGSCSLERRFKMNTLANKKVDHKKENKF